HQRVGVAPIKITVRFIAFFHSIWVILRKDIRVLLRQPVNIAATLLPPLSFLLVNALGAVAVGRNPVALVTLDHSAKGQQMAQIIHNADVFRITDATPAQAKTLLNNVEVAAIITIPADFTQRVNAHENAPIYVLVNNLNLDFTNDIRRSVPDAITQYYQAQGGSSPIKVSMLETDLRHRDVEFFQYNVLPTILLLLMISGLINGGLSTAREWESRTVKELLLSPVSRGAIITGKVLAGFVITFLLGTLVLLLGYALGWTQPQGVYWLSALLTIALVSLFGAGLGVAIGAALRRVQIVIAVSINVAIYLFFLAGGIGVLAFEPTWLQNVAAFVPLTYGRHALEQAVFYSASDQFGLDMAVLALSALVAIGLGIISMRRGIAS
ncbi:MAG TPA: ABC transporter permease, partial [Ktedonobacteraceae bacterium]|nr:ABC transporter permease [Ktedonobacteraceae bacterium]